MIDIPIVCRRLINSRCSFGFSQLVFGSIDLSGFFCSQARYFLGVCTTASLGFLHEDYVLSALCQRPSLPTTYIVLLIYACFDVEFSGSCACQVDGTGVLA